MKKFGILGMMFVLALAACASDSDKPKEDKADTPKAEKIKTDNLICPQTAILQQAQQVRDYGGEKPDPTQLVATAHMNSVEGDCAYRKDGIDLKFMLHMSAMRGPRLGGSQASFPYFIAVVDPAESILNRQVVTAQFKFAGADKTADDSEPLHVFIPLAESAIQGGPDYRVLVGFKLPKDQMGN